MIGYHYTSVENYRQIRENGLVPYYVPAAKFAARFDINPFPDGVYGVWLWDHEPTGVAEFGNLIWQLSTKESTTIVKLRVSYHKDDRLESADGELIKMYHDGNIGKFQYHEDETARIITRTIPPTNITLVRTFNLLDVLK